MKLRKLIKLRQRRRRRAWSLRAFRGQRKTWPGASRGRKRPLGYPEGALSPIWFVR